MGKGVTKKGTLKMAHNYIDHRLFFDLPEYRATTTTIHVVDSIHI